MLGVRVRAWGKAPLISLRLKDVKQAHLGHEMGSRWACRRICRQPVENQMVELVAADANQGDRGRL